MSADASTLQSSNPQSPWQRRVVTPIMAQLKQGITPEKIALTLALGTVLGAVPIIGVTTLLCTLTAWRLRLNQPIMQLVNYLTYPLQLLLLLPFYRAGEVLFRQEPVPIFSITDLLVRFQADPTQFLVDYGRVGFYGVVVWGLLAGPVVALLYYLIRAPLRRMRLNVEPQQT